MRVDAEYRRDVGVCFGSEGRSKGGDTRVEECHKVVKYEEGAEGQWTWNSDFRKITVRTTVAKTLKNVLVVWH